MLGLAASLQKGGASLLTFVKDNLKLYLDFKSNKSNTLKFPSEGSTSFDGVDDVIDFGNITDINNATNLTMVMWAKRLESNDAVTFEKSSGYTHRVSINISTDGNVYANLATGSGHSFGFCSLSGTEWNHIAYVFDGTQSDNASRLKLYVNGVAQTLNFGSYTIPTSIPSDTSTVKIGLDTPNSLYSTGSVCNAGIWTRSLSAEEVQSIMNKSYSQLKGVEKTSLVMWQSLDSETASGRTPIEQNAKTETAPQETENKIVLNSHSTTTYTQILNESDRTFASQGNWVQGSGTFEFGNTDVYSEGALKISSAGWVYLATNGSGFDTALVSGSIYKIQFTWTVVDTSHAQNFWFGIDSSFGNYGLWRRYQFNTDQLPEAEQVVTIYHQHDGGNYFYFRNTASSSCEFHIKNISCELIGNNVGISNATTTTSVYGGNAPILPRAVDVAKEGQADAIGDGSARFNTVNINGTDRISIEKTLVLGTNDFTMTAWANSIGGDSGYQGVVSIGTATNNQSAYMGILSSNEWGFGLFGANYDFGYTVVNGEWHHLAMTREGSNIKLYFDGILVDTQSAGSLDITDGGTHIASIGDNDTYNFNGDISQVGIWQGALTQAQIQSLMESTSYAKIPADVKSTLGSELLISTGWTTNDGWGLSNGTLTFNDTGNGGTVLSASNMTNSGLATGTTYKLQYTIGALSSGTADIRIQDSNGNVIIDTKNLTNGSYTEYFSATSTNNGLGFRFTGLSSSGSSWTITDYSLKEVSNDLVAYYPLDGSSSANGVTQDVTTGEVLGAELLGDGQFSEDLSQGSQNDNWYLITSGVANHEISNGRYRYTDSGTSTLRAKKNNSNVTLEVNKLHKMTFEIFDNDAYIQIVTNSETLIANATYPIGTNTVYFTPTATHTSFNIKASSVSPSYSMDNASLKQVTSNTGVLK